MPKSREINFEEIFQGLPGCYLLLSPELDLIAATDTYLAITHTKAKDILNRNVFDVFPENPITKDDEGVKSLSFSLKEVLRTKLPHTMPSLRYDIKLPKKEGGKFVARWWRITNSPIFNAAGEIYYIVNAVEDISKMVDKLESAQDTLKGLGP